MLSLDQQKRALSPRAMGAEPEGTSAARRVPPEMRPTRVTAPWYWTDTISPSVLTRLVESGASSVAIAIFSGLTLVHAAGPPCRTENSGESTFDEPTKSATKRDLGRS